MSEFERSETDSEKKARLERELADLRARQEIEEQKKRDREKLDREIQKTAEKQQRKEAKEAEKLRKRRMREKTRREKQVNSSSNIVEQEGDPAIIGVIARLITAGILLVISGIIGLCINLLLNIIVPYGNNVEHWYLWLFDAAGTFNAILIITCLFGLLFISVGIIMKMLHKVYLRLYKKIKRIIKPIENQIESNDLNDF